MQLNHKGCSQTFQVGGVYEKLPRAFANAFLLLLSATEVFCGGWVGSLCESLRLYCPIQHLQTDILTSNLVVNDNILYNFSG